MDYESFQHGETQGIPDDERKRIAEQLHHSIAQSLYGVFLLCKVIQQKDIPSDLKVNLLVIESVIDSTLKEVLDLAQEIRPMLLDDLGLIPAIRSYVHWTQQRTGLTVTFSTLLPPIRYPAEVETALFRLCQEAVSILVSQLGTERVEVQLLEENGVVLVLRDCRVHQLAHGFYERLESKQSIIELGGNIQVTSKSNEGTYVRAWIPIDLIYLIRDSP